jgi:peptidoglycan/xylan/chitin deacetylase (PgdA/CDA1 family)
MSCEQRDRLGTSSRFNALVTLTFDDGLLCQFENAYPVLRQHSVGGVAFIPTGLVGDLYEGRPSMSLEQLRKLKIAGWEVGSHTVSHPHLARHGRTRLPLEALEAELHDSKNWLLANGFPVISFAYPGGQHNDEIARICRRYYRYARTTSHGLNDVVPTHAQLKSFRLCQPTVASWRQEVDAAITLGKWLIATIHSVAETRAEIQPGQERWSIAQSDLARCVEHVVTAGVPVRTFHEVALAVLDGRETP